MNNISSLIINELQLKPEQLAKSIASKLDIPVKVINHHLHISLKNKVSQSSGFKWSVIGSGDQDLASITQNDSLEHIATSEDHINTSGKQELSNKNNTDSSNAMTINNLNDDVLPPTENTNFLFDSLQAIRNRLLDLTGRNRLLNFKHGKTGLVRIIDELPDQLAQTILDGEEVTFIPIEEPTRKELIKHGYIVVDEEGMDVKAKPEPTAKEWAKIKGFNTNYELPRSDKSRESKHNDANIQCLLFSRELEGQLRSIRLKANTAIEETGANVLYLAFGFLEWFEDETPDMLRQAPLYLIPVKIDRASLNKKSGAYNYTIEYTSEDIISNLSLREKLKHDFHLSLPELTDELLPEEYFKSLKQQLLKHKPKWKLKRFATLAMFDFSKLLMYLDLDPESWPEGPGNIQNHQILQKFFAKEGEEEDVASSNFVNEYEIDSLEQVHELYPLIDDADSSQHSALVDAIKGKNLVIEGPPGSGKSQTITNLIAAAISQGKKVLFVAEKMAALQVVKSRLKRAGLGDFCLELHSHKTQKKQVYANIAKRIQKQKTYRYPKSIDIDLQMYEEKKDVLTNYANLINSKWKNTGKTIHEIFSTATRFREEFPNVSLKNIQPDQINGDLFDEMTSRRMTDDIKRYVDVYSEVKKQLGQDQRLANHPWFGVYNKSIQLFDSDEICLLLQEFNNAINLLSLTLTPLNQQLECDCEEEINSVAAVKIILNDLPELPEINGSEIFSALDKITYEEHPEHKRNLRNYKSAKKKLNRLVDELEPCALIEGTHFNTFKASNLDLCRKFKNTSLHSLSDIFKKYESLLLLQTITGSLIEDITSINEQSLNLDGLLSPSLSGFNELNEFLEHSTKLDVLLVGRRHDLFDNELLDKTLPDLTEIIDQIKPLRDDLCEYVDLNKLTSLRELKEIAAILDNAGMFCWLSSDWRSAKTKLLSLAIGLKPSFKILGPKVPKLIQYLELLETLNAGNFSSSLKHEYNGIDTQIDEITHLRSWYKGVRVSYGVGFGKRVAFSTSLFSMSDEVFKGVKHLAQHKTISELKAFFELFNSLENIIDHPLFRDKNFNFECENGIVNFTKEMGSSIESLQLSLKNNCTLTVTKELIINAEKLFNLEKLLDNDNAMSSTFGAEYKLSVRENSEDAYEKISSTLVLWEAIAQLDSELIGYYLFCNCNEQNLKHLKNNLEAIQVEHNNYLKTFLAFSDRVELDKLSWFSICDGTLQSYLLRNDQAINQPRWLSTWIDFIRVRASLSQNGLEKLLRSVETAELDLKDIEHIYIYSVFDKLAREVIAENNELAYFSGADQSAIRNQFKEYDTKLKSLQQEKIAYQVAKSGYSQIASGVSSGRVSGYTEMGLINNEINKKTRHVPIRQLLRRSANSLVSLKPCFMMGPHSVAQYLKPGQIEFDLVVMDEASQIKPEDALGTIARGKQLIVVGDPKQLPPTSFFDKIVQSEDEDTTAIEQSESILDVSLPMFTARRLRWHYRSRHESLIAFSNQEFYDNNLVVFPSPSRKSEEFGIKFTHVKSGRFINQHNIEEAKVIAQAVCTHLLNSPNESIGVVAMSSKQRDQIDRCVEEISKDNPQIRHALSDNASLDEPLFIKNLENVQGDERDVIYISCTYGPQEAGAAQMPQRFGPINSAAGGRRLNVLFTRSKKRMHVFSSMTEGHILATENSSPGVHALKSFLAYAETGKLQQIEQTGKAPDSDFEIAVMKALKLEGFHCVPQVGVAGYYIDLAVQDPGQPGRYLMGIECDGATYHSAKSARDRDRLRQSVLEGLGWNIKRIWSTDWFKNPQAQLKPIIELLHLLKTDGPIIDDDSSEEQEIEALIEQEEVKLHELNDLIETELSLAQKLQKFEAHLIDQFPDDVPVTQRLLRPAMIDTLCEFMPVSKSEFLEVIPSWLRTATSKKHGKHLESVLNIIAEDEKEIINK